MRFRENAPAGDPNAFVSAATQKDFNTFWLAMTQEFNKVLRAFSKSDRDLAVAQMRQIVTTAINAEVASVTTRKAIMSKTYDGLVEVGLVDA
jgi:hypothetical protein